MTYEEAYGRLWTAKARKEGHMRGVPKSPSDCKPSPYSVRVAEMVREGMTHAQIAAKLGISRPRVTQIYRASQ